MRSITTRTRLSVISRTSRPVPLLLASIFVITACGRGVSFDLRAVIADSGEPYSLTRRIALEHAADGHAVWLYSPAAVTEVQRSQYAVLFGTVPSRVIYGSLSSFLANAKPHTVYAADIPALRSNGYRGRAVYIHLPNDTDTNGILPLRKSTGEYILIHEEHRASTRIPVPLTAVTPAGKDTIRIGEMLCHLPVTVPARNAEEAALFIARRLRNARFATVSPFTPAENGIIGDIYLDGGSLSALLIRYRWAYDKGISNDAIVSDQTP